MSTHFHWVAWIDHAEATLIAFNDHEADEQVVRAKSPGGHLHHRAGAGDDGREAMDPHFFPAVAAALAPAGEILLLGPGQAKQEFAAFLERQHPALSHKVVKVEAADRQTAPQLLAHARQAFKAIDRMLPQGGRRPAGAA